MSSLKTVWKSQSFPSVDDRIGWTITLICLVIGLLLTVGALNIPDFSPSGWTWAGIVLAQVVTAVVVAFAAQYSMRKRDPSRSADPSPAASEPNK